MMNAMAPMVSMITFNNLYDKICVFENIHSAYVKARKNKRYRVDVLQFTCNLETNLHRIQDELLEERYKTGPYRMFYVYEPKKRMILCLPFKDRVVHHAICNIIEPIFEKRFIYDSYACRVNKGIHKGSDKLTGLLRKARKQWDDTYCLKCDVKQYFPSINHDILVDIVKRKIQCRRTMDLLENIIRSHNRDFGVGIPIGNLTSQLFANVYLNELDYFVKQSLRIKAYIRYMDDFIILGSDKRELHRLKSIIETFLINNLNLTLNHKSGIFPARVGIDFLGYRTWPDHKLIRKRSVRNIRRGIRKLLKDGTTKNDVTRSLSSWFGYCSHADTWRLRERILKLIARE